MCILHVIDRILICIALQYIDIHHHRRINRISNKCVASSVHAHLLHQLFQSNNCSSALGEFELFATFHDLYKLANHNFHVVLRVIAGTCSSCLKTMNVSVMICAQHVDADIEATFALINIVSSIRCKVSQVAIFFNNDAIFIITKISCAKPNSASFFKDMALLAQLLNAVFNCTRFVERAL